jgi:hypothetical protein
MKKISQYDPHLILIAEDAVITCCGEKVAVYHQAQKFYNAEVLKWEIGRLCKVSLVQD